MSEVSPPPRLEDLLDLLFDEGELRRWFEQLGLGAHLPGATATFAELCHGAAAVLTRRGRVDTALLGLLTARAGSQHLQAISAFARSQSLTEPHVIVPGSHADLKPLRQAIREAADVLPGVFHVAGGPDALSEVAVELVLQPEQEPPGPDDLSPRSKDRARAFSRSYSDMPAEPFPLQKLLDLPHRRWVILGEPGSGKTTSLRRFALHILDETKLVPIILRISEVHTPDQALEDLCPGSRDAFWSAVARGEAVLLVDGLDEAIDQPRARRALGSLSSRLGHCLMVVTSRPVAYEPLGAHHRELMLCPLQRSQQERLLRGWLPEARHAEIPGHLNRLSSRMARLAENPLILTLMARLLRMRRPLPRRRVELYQEVVHLLLTRGHSPDLADAQRPFEQSVGPSMVLAWLALHSHSQESEQLPVSSLKARISKAPDEVREGLGAIPLERWLRRVGTGAGLLEPDRTEDRWSFAHRTIREFLAARALADEVLRLGGVGKCGLGSELDQRLQEAKAKPSLWAEVFSLLTGLLVGTETEALVTRLVEGGAGYKPLLYRMMPDAEGLSEGAVWSVLGLASDRAEWAQRTEVLKDLPDLVEDVGVAVRLLARFAEGATHGADLFWAHYLLCEVAEGRLGLGDEEVRAEARTLANQVFQGHRVDARQEALRLIEERNWWRPIPTGTFWLGSDKRTDHDRDDEEGPRHKVLIMSPFDMLAVPVTGALYDYFDPGHRAGRESFDGRLPPARQDEVPAYNLSWYEASAFAAWIGGAGHVIRLPTETEWEYACRAGSTTRFWSGNSNRDLYEVDWVSTNSGGHPHRVGSPPTTRGLGHAWGLRDMHGNVWEWCSDRWERNYDRWKGGHTHDPCRKIAIDDPALPRVVRGGSWEDQAQLARSACRGRRGPESGLVNIGFRLVRVLAK